MNLSAVIADMILDMLSESGEAEIKRNDLAEQIGCVPSQINYVLSSRFTPEQGYIVESRRGGGGYIKITRAAYQSADMVKMHLINALGDTADEKTCRANIHNLYVNGLLEEAEARLLAAATLDSVYKDLPKAERDKVRASIFKQMLLTTMQ